MIRNLDLSLLRAFTTVAATNSMTVAATSLCVTQGAVSQRIKRLEVLLDCALFDRNGRGLKLTRQGENLLGPSKQLLNLNDEIFAEMAGQTLQGEVRLGIPYDLVTNYLPAVLRGFADTHPHVEVSLVCDASPDLVSAFNRGEIDVALVEEPVDAIGGECLCVDRLLWIGHKDGRASARRPLPLSIVDETCVFRPAILDALRQSGIVWRCVFENGSIEATMTTVRADLAVTASLASVIPDDLDVLSPDCGLPGLPGFSISLYSRTSRQNPAAEELARHIRSEVIARARHWEQRHPASTTMARHT